LSIKFLYKLSKQKRLTLKKISGFLIFIIALAVTILMTLPRVLSLFEIVNSQGGEYANVSYGDIILRFSYLLGISYFILQFNSNWWYQIKISISLFLEIVITFLIHIIFLYGFVKFFLFIYKLSIGLNPNESETGYVYFGYLIVFIILIFIAKILRYQVFREEDKFEKEILKQQGIQSELAALKSQINPHFLFNSLNSLSSLVRENKEAKIFVTKLSFLYRYILQSGEKDLVSLKEELKFLESYTHLIKTRYRDNFSINIDIPNELYDKELPVLTLQLLVENTVKHNEISVNKPLIVTVFTEKDYLIVENKINPRLSIVDNSGQGLSNIDKRCFLLKNKHILIETANNKFVVKIPLD